MVVLRFFFCFRLLIFWGNFVECMILFLARVIFVVVVEGRNSSSYKRFRCNCCCSYGNNYNKFLNGDNMNEERISPFMLAFIADMNEKNGYEEEDFSNT